MLFRNFYPLEFGESRHRKFVNICYWFLDIIDYRIAKIYCHINRFNAILHADIYYNICEKPINWSYVRIIVAVWSDRSCDKRLVAWQSQCVTQQKLVLLEYCTQLIFCGIDAITDNYLFLLYLTKIIAITLLTCLLAKFQCAMKTGRLTGSINDIKYKYFV